MSDHEEVRVKQDAARVGLQHLQEARKRVPHIVIVTEHSSTVTGPDILPNILRVDAYAIDEPLRVIVQGDLEVLALDYNSLDEKDSTYINLVRASFSSASQNSI